MKKILRVASTQISLAPIASTEIFWQRLENLLQQAKTWQCDLVLLPEYCCLSLLVHTYQNLTSFKERLKAFSIQGYQDYETKIQQLARRYKLAIVGGSYPVCLSPGKTVNRCIVVNDGEILAKQDKLNMTRFEAEQWQISAPAVPELKVFTYQGIKAAVAICYDIEFPHVTKAAADAGVQILFVPSCTDHVHGYWRVRHCAHARTVENQCFVVMASVVDGNPNFPEMDIHYGKAGIFSPCDGLFPEQGVLAEGQLNQEGIVSAELDFALLEEIRRHGTVLNLRDQQQAKVLVSAPR